MSRGNVLKLIAQRMILGVFAASLASAEVEAKPIAHRQVDAALTGLLAWDDVATSKQSGALQAAKPKGKPFELAPAGLDDMGTITLAQAAADGEPAASTSPHVLIAGLEVTFARRVSTDHRAIEPTKVFSETDRTIFMVFRNGSSEPVQANVDVYTIDVEGFEPDSRVWSNARVRLPPDERHSLSLNGPDEGLPPGTYRFDINAGDSRQSSVVEVKPLHPYALREDEAELGPGYNIALAALGGRIEEASQWDDEGWSRRHLIDGLTWVRAPDDSDHCIICGWASREGHRHPDVVLSFHENREAEIAAVVVDTRRFPSRQVTVEQYTAQLPKHVAVHVSSEAASHGFQRVATARLRRDAERQIVLLPEGTRAKYLRFEVLENFGGPAVALSELEVIEANSRERSIVEDAEINLASAALGGVLVRYTSFAKGQSAANLFDAEDRGTSWLSHDRYFPQDFTIAFKNDQVALVDKVRLTLSSKEDPSTWPSEVAIALSRQSPLDGFVELGRFAVERRAGPQEFSVGQEARFIKVRLLDNHGGQRTSLGGIAVIEGRRAGYTPMLLRDDAVLPLNVAGAPEEEIEEDDTVAEVEPNDELASAGRLPLNAALRGEIDPLGESDFFAVPELGSEASALTIYYTGRPYIRHGLSLLDSGGVVISHFDPGDLPATDAKLTFALTRDERYLTLTEPPASVVVIWDTSSSMQDSKDDLEGAVREYIRRAPPSQRMNLIRFSGDVEVLLDGFTSDKSRLQDALGGQFRPYGRTRLYDAVLEGMELLADVQGNRAIVVMTDGEDNGNTWHATFWREVENNRIRLYTIGLGQGLTNYSYAFATSGERILRHLALGTDGDTFFAAESAALQDFYAKIADELSRPATYLLKPMVERGEGTLRLIATGEQIPGAVMPAVHVIYDLSGSMLERGPDGRPKYRSAQDAISSTLDGLPDGAPFGFTVYGARIPEKIGKGIACTDIVTLQELGPLDKRVVRDFVARQKPGGGTTPLADSVRHVAQNFPGKNGGIIVAVTDGIEECDPDPMATIAALKASKLQYVELNVVGFALKDPEARKMMEAIAETGGGRYFDAADGAALAQALKEAMAAKYTLHDAADRVVASGSIDGSDVNVPAGFYRVVISAAGSPIQARDVRIDHDHMTTISVNKVGSEVDVVVSAPESLAAMREARRTCGQAAAALDDDLRAARIQTKLNQLGFDVGPADNRPGQKTRQGIAAFANKYELTATLPVGLLLEQHLDCVLAVGKTYLVAD